MPCQATLNQLVNIVHSTQFNWPTTGLDDPSTGITTDTRTMEPGQIFVALRGLHFDGHHFIQQAAQGGAKAAIVDQQWEIKGSSIPFLQVADTLAAYQAIAHWWRGQFQIPIIAITGSVGKTTTKELVAAVLATTSGNPHSSPHWVLKTQANYNNEIGVPQTLLKLDAHHRYAVIEMGMRGSGEVALLAQIARPTMALITNVGTAHLERLGSEEAIARAECETLLELNADGVAILNHDDARLMNTAAQLWQGTTLTFGLNGGDLHGELLSQDRLRVGDYCFPLPLPGRHNGLNYLAALSVIQVLGMDWTPLQSGLKVHLPGGRARRYETAGDILLLDETYNAGVESMIATLHLLSQTPGIRRIAVLGTMKELGPRSVEFHQRVGETVAQLGLDYLLVLADEPEASAFMKGAQKVPSQWFTRHDQLIHYLIGTVKAGDRLLFKASRSIGMDRVVDGLRQYLDKANIFHEKDV